MKSAAFPSATTEDRKPFWAKCEPCNQCWAPVYTPTEVFKFVEILKAIRCPKCGSSKEGRKAA
jgi:DNA-directed RNA polymerase subunit RPC12/RpoP